MGPVLAPGRVLAVAAVLIAACSREAATLPDLRPPELSPAPLPPRVVFLGSSTTAGAGASTPALRWSSLVSRRSGWVEVNRGLSRSTLTNLGRRTPSGEERWYEALEEEGADAVIVMYGANDVLARVPLGDPGTPGTFRHAAAVVVGGLREALPEAVIVVCTPQPSFATAGAREPYDLALAEAAARAGALFVPAGSAFPEQRLAELSSDRLHLNDAGHAALAEFVLERVEGRIGARGAPGPAGGVRHEGDARR